MIARRGFLSILFASITVRPKWFDDDHDVVEFGEAYEVVMRENFWERSWEVCVQTERRGKWYARGLIVSREKMWQLTGKRWPTKEDARPHLENLARKIIDENNLPIKLEGATVEMARVS